MLAGHTEPDRCTYEATLWAKATLLTLEFCVMLGWCLAQHDTLANTFLLKLNRQADSAAKRHVLISNEPWDLPESWIDGHTVVLRMQGKGVVDVKQAVRKAYVWEHVPRSTTNERKSPMPFWLVWSTSKDLASLWK